MKKKMRLSKEIMNLIGPKNMRRIAAREWAYAKSAEARGDMEEAEDCRELMNWALKTLNKRRQERND